MAEKKIIPISTEQFQEYFSVYNKADEKDNSVIYSGITENLKNFAVGHYFWFVADCITMKTKDVSPNIEIHTPYNHKEWSNQNVQHFLDLIHPEDSQYLLSALVSSARIYKNMRRPEKNNIRFNFLIQDVFYSFPPLLWRLNKQSTNIFLQYWVFFLIIAIS